MVERSDVVTSVIAASAAFSGLILVFLGVLASTFQSLLGSAGKETLARLKGSAYASLGVFVLSLASVAVSLAWQVSGGGHCFYVCVVVLFCAVLAALVGLASFVTLRVLVRP